MRWPWISRKLFDRVEDALFQRDRWINEMVRAHEDTVKRMVQLEQRLEVYEGPFAICRLDYPNWNIFDAIRSGQPSIYRDGERPSAPRAG